VHRFSAILRSALPLDVPRCGTLRHDAGPAPTYTTPMRCHDGVRELAFAVLLGWLAVGCASSTAAEEPAVFGGEGASLKIRGETPLPTGPDAQGPIGACGRVVPPSDVALLDDFEDNDDRVFKGYQREGWWFSIGDESGGTIVPEKGKFHPEALPATESTSDNHYAIHLAASGFKDWGAVWGSTLSWTDDGIRCPWNGGHFEALRFRAKGSGTVNVRLAMPDTQAKEFGGQCSDRCYDFHGKRVSLTDTWTEYVVRFDRLQQGGWGKEVRFDPRTLLGVQFSIDGSSPPVDFWLDDIEFLPKGSLAAANTPPPASTPPASAPTPAHGAGASR
jgi:hypothetical protein